VFTSDHGEMIGDHAMLEKRSFYEEASRVPLLISAPWLGAGQRKIPGSIGQIDLVPTLLDLLGDDIPGQLHGKSQLGVLQGEETLDDNDVFIQWNGIHPDMEDRHLGSAEINRMLTLPWRSVVSDRWKLNLCAGDQCELFDLRSDPYEMTNLFDDPAHRDRIRDMAARVYAWQVRTGDTAPLPSV
jgi:arylsulfatase A-like enzyme